MCEQYSKRSTSIVFFVLSVAANIGQTGVQLWSGHRPLDVHVFGQTLDISTSLVRLPTPPPSPSLPYSPFRAWDLVSHAATATVACLFNWLSALGTAQAQLHPPESAHDSILFARSNCQPAISHCLRRLLIMTDNASSVGNNNGARALISSVGGYLLVSLDDSLLINTK